MRDAIMMCTSDKMWCKDNVENFTSALRNEPNILRKKILLAHSQLKWTI